MKLTNAQKYNMRSILCACTIALLLFSCQTNDYPLEQKRSPLVQLGHFPAHIPVDSIIKDTLDYDTTQWLELIDLDSSILLDMHYATKNNFVGQVLYNCPRCFLRPEAAKAVVAAHQELKTIGLGLKMFDCYRPRAVQYKLWEIFPKPGYVANPATGSIHNRGGAIDLTIVDSTGQVLDMGTDFDFFGPKAHHTYTNLPVQVLANRLQLKKLMKKHGFSSIRREWWHYNYKGTSYELADELWNCK